MLLSIDSCQNKVSADQFHLTLSRAQVSTHPGRVFFEGIRWQVTGFKWLQAHLLKFMWNVGFMSLWPSTINILISNWPRTQEFSQLFKNTGGKDRCFSLFSPWSRVGHAPSPIFMRKIYATSWNLFTLTAEADKVLCQLVMFLTVFFLWMYKMKYSCYQESSVIHGWFVYLVFGWEMRRLSKFGNSISDGIVFVFHLA